MRRPIRTTEPTREEVEQKADLLENRVISAREQIRTLKQEKVEAEKDLKTILDKRERLEKEDSDKEKEGHDLNERNQQLTHEITELLGRIPVLKQEVTGLELQVQTLEGTIQSGVTRMTEEARSQNELLKKKNEEREASIAQLKDDERRKTQDLENLGNKTLVAEGVVEAHANTIKTLEERISKLEQQESFLVASVKALEQKGIELQVNETNLAKSTTELESVRKAIALAESDLSAKKTEYEEYDAKMKARDAAFRVLESTVNLKIQRLKRANDEREAEKYLNDQGVN